MILRKIYEELVLIRKELQAIRSSRESSSVDITAFEQQRSEKETYKLNIYEKRYVSSRDSLMVVSFQLHGRDWYELSKSPHWKAVENFLSRKKSTNNQTI